MAIKRQSDQWAQVNGHAIRYWKLGDAPATLLLLHGMGCSALEWSENIEYLAQNFTVIAVDMIGFGRSSKPEDYDYSPQHQAKTIIDLLDQLGTKDVHLAGNSYGGRVAMEMACLLGNRTKSMTLVASAGGGSDAPWVMRLMTLPLLGRLLNRPDKNKHQRGWKSVFVHKNKICQERIDEKFNDSLLPGAQMSTLATMRSMIDLNGFKRQDIASLHRRIKSLDIKTLIIWGDSDPSLPVHHAHNFQKILKRPTVVIFEKCGHAPQIEQALKFNKTLLRFALKNELATAY